MADRYEIDYMPPEDVRLAMCEWLRAHGIEPLTVPVPGWIERQPDLYRVAFESCVPDPVHKVKLNAAGDDVEREARHVQLEGLPLPWPDELHAWMNYEALSRFSGHPKPEETP